MKRYVWDPEKNAKLLAERGIQFEMVEKEIIEERATVLENQSFNYPGQRRFLVYLNDYPYVVPYEEDAQTVRLITIFPDRRHK
jgi:uncharacterized DUF497 family protein